MNTSWLTWKCFVAGLQMLGIISLTLGSLVGVTVLLVWIADSLHRPKLALCVAIGAVAIGIVVIGMLDCARIIH